MLSFPPERQLLSRPCPLGPGLPGPHPCRLCHWKATAASSGKSRPFVSPHFLRLWEPRPAWDICLQASFSGAQGGKEEECGLPGRGLLGLSSPGQRGRTMRGAPSFPSPPLPTRAPFVCSQWGGQGNSPVFVSLFFLVWPLASPMGRGSIGAGEGWLQLENSGGMGGRSLSSS